MYFFRHTFSASKKSCWSAEKVMDEKAKRGGKKVKKHDTSGSAGGDFFGGAGVGGVGKIPMKTQFLAFLGVFLKKGGVGSGFL